MRARLIATLVAVAVALSTSGSAGATRSKSVRWPRVVLTHVTTHETFVLRPDGNGQLGPRALRGWRHFLRCHHTGREHAIASRLPQLLYTVSHHFGDRSIEVVAGYRAPRIARAKGNPRSPHQAGRACDFRVAGVDAATLRDYLRQTFRHVGVGYYPRSSFVHLDVERRHDAYWIDYSGPGERAQYSRPSPSAPVPQDGPQETPHQGQQEGEEDEPQAP